MIVRLLTEHHLKFLTLKGDCRDSSESTLVKMLHCWNSHATAHLLKGTESMHGILGQLKCESLKKRGTTIGRYYYTKD